MSKCCNGCGEYGLDMNKDSFCGPCEYVNKIEKRLDDACELIKECQEHFEMANKCGMGSSYIKNGIDTFLSQIKDEGENA